MPIPEKFLPKNYDVDPVYVRILVVNPKGDKIWQKVDVDEFGERPLSSLTITGRIKREEVFDKVRRDLLQMHMKSVDKVTIVSESESYTVTSDQADEEKSDYNPEEWIRTARSYNVIAVASTDGNGESQKYTDKKSQEYLWRKIPLDDINGLEKAAFGVI